MPDLKLNFYITAFTASEIHHAHFYLYALGSACYLVKSQFDHQKEIDVISL